MFSPRQVSASVFLCQTCACWLHHDCQISTFYILTVYNSVILGSGVSIFFSDSYVSSCHFSSGLESQGNFWSLLLCSGSISIGIKWFATIVQTYTFYNDTPKYINRFFLPFPILPLLWCKTRAAQTSRSAILLLSSSPCTSRSGELSESEQRSHLINRKKERKSCKSSGVEDLQDQGWAALVKTVCFDH